MKILLAFIFLALVHNTSGQALLNRLRGMYGSAGQREDSAKKMYSMLKPVTETSEPVLLCYKGALTMMQAKFFFNPFTKFGYFLKGKRLVENAIARDSSNIEMRYLRFTLQSNLPSFLCYNSQLKTDKDYLINHCLLLSNPVLQEIIISFLLTSKYCSNEDVKKLQHARGSSIG